MFYSPSSFCLGHVTYCNGFNFLFSRTFVRSTSLPNLIMNFYEESNVSYSIHIEELPTEEFGQTEEFHVQRNGFARLIYKATKLPIVIEFFERNQNLANSVLHNKSFLENFLLPSTYEVVKHANDGIIRISSDIARHRECATSVSTVICTQKYQLVKIYLSGFHLPALNLSVELSISVHDNGTNSFFITRVGRYEQLNTFEQPIQRIQQAGEEPHIVQGLYELVINDSDAEDDLRDDSRDL